MNFTSRSLLLIIGSNQFWIFRSRVSLASDRGSPWNNSYSLQHNGSGGRRDDDDGGFANANSSQRGSFSIKRDSMASRELLPGAISNHNSNRDLSTVTTSASVGGARPSHTNTMDSSYTPRSYTPRADPSTTSLPRSHPNHNNSSLSRTHSTKMNTSSSTAALARSHTSMDTLGVVRNQPTGAADLSSSASLPRMGALAINGGGTNGPTMTNGRLVR